MLKIITFFMNSKELDKLSLNSNLHSLKKSIEFAALLLIEVVSVLRLVARKGGIELERDLEPLAKEEKTEKVSEKSFVPDHFISKNIWNIVWCIAGMGNIRPAGRIRPPRPFYAVRRHLQKHKLRSRIKPKTFHFFKGHLRTSRPFLLFTAGAYLGKHCAMPPFDSAF